MRVPRSVYVTVHTRTTALASVPLSRVHIVEHSRTDRRVRPQPAFEGTLVEVLEVRSKVGVVLEEQHSIKQSYTRGVYERPTRVQTLYTDPAFL